MTTNKYALFAGDNYYPSGGVGDFIDFFETIEQAKERVSLQPKNREFDWWHVLDVSTFKIVAQG